MSTPLSQSPSRAPRFDAAVDRARLTVVPRRTRRAPRVPFVSLVSLLLVGGVAGLLLFNTHMQQASFVASSMEEQAAVLAGTEESLRMELHRLRDPQHVAAEAKRLGMVPSSSPAFLRLSDGKVLGRPAEAVPTDAVRITPAAPVKPQSLRPRLVIVDAAKARRDRAQDGRDTSRLSGEGSRDRASDGRTKSRNGRDDAAESAGRTP